MKGNGLLHFAHLEPSGLSVVDHTATMGFEPGHQSPCGLPGVAVISGMGARAHPVVVHAFRRRCSEVQCKVIDEPLRMGQSPLSQGSAQWRYPRVVFVDNVDDRSRLVVSIEFKWRKHRGIKKPGEGRAG